MTGRVIFEQERRGHLWRLEIASFRGRTFANWRKWYRKGEEWQPTREGCTLPLDQLAALTGCLMAYHGLDLPDGFKP